MTTGDMFNNPGIPSRKRALILNWRDPWHPRAGGAELVTLRIAERLTQRGWYIEWFSASYPGASEDEVREGIRFVRAGTSATVHLHAMRRYALRGLQDFDVAVDQVNTIPFFSPLYLKIPAIAFFHQLAREVWFYESLFPINIVGYLVEPLYLQAYRLRPIITVSQSSASSLRKIGMRGAIHVIPEAVDEPRDTVVPVKAPQRDIAVVGRVTPSKRLEYSIRAAALLKRQGWGGCLHLVGAGEARYVNKILALGARLLGPSMKFHGRVSNAERTDILRNASVLWMTSIREGWGLVVTEAARHGTPAVVFNVPGLRDSVKDGVTGIVVPASVEALARSTMSLFADLNDFALRALHDSAQYNWEATAQAFEAVLARYASPMSREASLTTQEFATEIVANDQNGAKERW